MGRITAQTAKQVIIQKVREAESIAIFNEFMGRKNTIVSGVVRRFEGPNMLVDLGKTEGVLHKSGQIYGEYYHVGERVRTLILDVKRYAHKVRVVLSRTHPDFVKRLFEMEVPEITEKVIEIKGVARESGHRTKIAVHSTDANVDCVGACVGVRGVRIKGVVNELNGEKIDIVKWSDVPEELLPNALKPAGVTGIVLSSEGRSASIIVPDEQFSLAIGKRGQNVRLASILTDWNLDIITESQFEKSGGEEKFDSDAEDLDESKGGSENNGETVESDEDSVASESSENNSETVESDEDSVASESSENNGETVESDEDSVVSESSENNSETVESDEDSVASESSENNGETVESDEDSVASENSEVVAKEEK